MIISNRLRLREIVQVDGRQTGLSAFRRWLDKNREKAVTFRGGDCIMMINHTRTFLRFASGFDTSFTQDGPPQLKKVIANALIIVEIRLEDGEWSPLRLTEFAERKGIELVNLKSFTEHYQAEQERRRAHARDLAAKRNK